MVYHIAIECIGGNRSSLADRFFSIKSRGWIAKIKYIRGNYIEREFLRGKKDYTQANGPGTRGVVSHYFLEDGLYEISSPQSWSFDDRYFAYIEDGQLWRVTKEEAIIWLNDHLE